MDALSEVLRVIKLDSAIYLNAEFSEPWCLALPEARSLAPMLSRPGEHLIIYHLLSEGRAHIELVGGERVPLSAGDLVSFPHGHAHMIGSGPRVTPIDARQALPGALEHGLDLLNLGGGGAPSRFICGFLACDPQLSHAFLAGLPPLIKINIRDDPAGRWLEHSLKFSVAQAGNREAGADAMLTKLSEVFFAETLRRYVRELPEGQTGWLAGARDADIGKALTLLHHQHAHPWTVAELARETGLSRTVLSDRFRHFLGESPKAYLTRWRLQVGARALTATSHGVAQIASDVGYESEAAFNRAFKREFGLPPARYRRDKAAMRAGANDRMHAVT
jgi:AraC-like DNA-binding protein